MDSPLDLSFLAFDMHIRLASDQDEGCSVGKLTFLHHKLIQFLPVFLGHILEALQRLGGEIGVVHGDGVHSGDGR